MSIENINATINELRARSACSTSPNLNFNQIASWLEELIRLRKECELSPEERETLKRIGEVTDEIREHIEGIIEGHSIEDLKGMNPEDEGSEGATLYREIGESLFGNGEFYFEMQDKLRDISNYMKENDVLLECPDGTKYDDASGFIHHENTNSDDDLVWLKGSEKLNIVVDKIKEFGW